ncbi:hypothetical protein HAX54_001979 [Datura stramonium]|uniref:Uncharacterized protein n=1 Tax=Datura stramonium TaxID=4076 RepID=A0ABS8T4P0_DATST|nr:hypothetical protein [Datura stramonium]
MQGMQELLEIASYQGWEHLFELPMPIMYEAEVSEFYSSLSFSNDDETMYANMFTLSTLEECECVARQGGIGVQSTISGFIEAQRCGTEEIEHLTMLLAQRDAKIVVLKDAQSGGEPGALMDLQEENATLKGDNAALRK